MSNVIVEKVEGWIWQIGIKKGVSFVVKFIISVLTGAKVAPILATLGITVDPATLSLGLAGFIGSGLTVLQNYLKTKYKLDWL